MFVFARKEEERAFALELGAAWAGATEDAAPEPLAAIIDTTPAWSPVLHALDNLEAGGRLVVNAIRKETADQAALLQLDYPLHHALPISVIIPCYFARNSPPTAAFALLAWRFHGK